MPAAFMKEGIAPIAHISSHLFYLCLGNGACVRRRGVYAGRFRFRIMTAGHLASAIGIRDQGNGHAAGINMADTPVPMIVDNDDDGYFIDGVVSGQDGGTFGRDEVLDLFFVASHIVVGILSPGRSEEVVHLGNDMPVPIGNGSTALVGYGLDEIDIEILLVCLERLGIKECLHGRRGQGDKQVLLGCGEAVGNDAEGRGLPGRSFVPGNDIRIFARFRYGQGAQVQDPRALQRNAVIGGLAAGVIVFVFEDQGHTGRKHLRIRGNIIIGVGLERAFQGNGRTGRFVEGTGQLPEFRFLAILQMGDTAVTRNKTACL